jgi:integrase
MPSLKLTALTVAKLKPPASGRAEHWDTVLPGLGLRVTDKGVKSWTVLYRVGARQRRATIGHYPATSLADARAAAGKLLEQVERGVDPLTARAEENKRQEADRFETVIGEFVARHAKPNNRGWERQDRDLRREFLPLWRNRAIGSIGRRDILAALDSLADRTSPRRANRYLALLKKLFAWCAERGLIEASPAAAIKPPGRELSRDRVLSADELRVLWHCCQNEGWPFGDLFRLLVLTAQRLGEVSAMRWRDVDLSRAIWTVPAEVAKNGVANEVPLSAPAVAILEELPRVSDEYVFPAANGSGNPVSGFSKAKARLDRDIAVALAGETGGKTAISPWRLHDLRRTAASGMAELRIAPHVIERVLNHVSGSRAGVAGVYNRFGYLPEKRQALETWAARITTIGGALPDNVVTLERVSRAKTSERREDKRTARR